EAEINKTQNWALNFFDNSNGHNENPYNIQSDLQEMMQHLVGIVRLEDELVQASEELKKLSNRMLNVKVTGNREYNNGWHTAIDLKNLLTVSNAITLSAIQRKESRGAHFREDYHAKSDTFSKHNTLIKKGTDGEMIVSKRPIPEIRDDLKKVIEEMK
ncbi:MAG: fumarate reductase/succinate dehydrogenase flavoprotein subunit, partial [Ignavibacteriales bacterium]